MASSSSTPSEFDAFLAYYANLSTEELIEFLNTNVPAAGLS